MSIKPIISVVLPVYNGDKYIKDAVTSVLNQTFKNFELIIINDGSTDNSLSIIKRIMKEDKRIKLIDRHNRGLVFSLNEGISLARGEFIVRMDADDICLPTRFEKQFKFMESYNIDLCGSWIQPFEGDKYLGVRKYPEKHGDIVISSIFYCPFAHPSTMIRSIVFRSLKYEDEIAEDYNLWCNIILNGHKVANLPEVLLKYRNHEEQITKNKAIELNLSANNISENFAKKLGLLESTVLKDKMLFINGRERDKYLDLSEGLKQLTKKYYASTDTRFEILLWLYLTSQPKTPYLYYNYRRLSLGYKKNNNETVLFLKSFLYLNPESVILGMLRRVYNKVFVK